MRFSSTSKTLALLISSIALISACSTPVKLEPTPTVEDKSPKVEAPVDTRAVNTVVAAPVDPFTVGALAKRSVYFDFDSYVVKDEYQPLLVAHSKFLAAHANMKILIQGNADERGGREYKLTLGQKRAEAVRKAMALLSVPEAQVEAVSLGEEKPKATGSDEASWAENRRADIVYQ